MLLELATDRGERSLKIWRPPVLLSLPTRKTFPFPLCKNNKPLREKWNHRFKFGTASKKSTKVFLGEHESSKVSKKDFELLLYLEFFFNVGTLFVRLDLIQFDDTRVQSVTVILFFSIIFDSAKLVVATLALNKVFRTFVVCNAVLKQ